jgi:hypothetical protein
MTVYISGAVTGKPNNNKPAFQCVFTWIHDAARRYSKEKVKIVNPLHVAARLRKSFKAQNRGEPEWEDYMRACIKKLCDAACVYFLEDWAQSEGATMERYIAKRLNIPCVDSIEELKKIMGAEHEH